MKFSWLWPLIISFSTQVFGHELCQQAGLLSLSFRPLGSKVTQESCTKEVTDLSEVEVTALHHIFKIHQEVAELFQVSVLDLFSYQLSVTLNEALLGPIISSAGLGSLTMGVLPDTNYSINTGIYLHELGHILAGMKNKKLPPILEDLDNSILFSETFADLLALTVHGKVITPMEESSTCLDRLRFITTFQYLEKYFFLNLAFLRKSIPAS